MKHLLKELDKLIEAALERILQPTHGDTITPLLLNGSDNASEGLDLALWNQIPLVLIDEHDKDNPVIVEIFETNRTAPGNGTALGNGTSPGNGTALENGISLGNETAPGNETASGNGTAPGNGTTAAPPAPSNFTSEEKKYKLAVKLVRGGAVATASPPRGGPGAASMGAGRALPVPAPCSSPQPGAARCTRAGQRGGSACHLHPFLCACTQSAGDRLRPHPLPSARCRGTVGARGGLASPRPVLPWPQSRQAVLQAEILEAEATAAFKN